MKLNECQNKNDKTDMKRKTVEYQGRFLGMNKVKAGGWYKTKIEVDRLKSAFLGLVLEAQFPKMSKIQVEVEYWSRHDVDNLAYMTKFFVDTLVNLHKLPNDTKPHFDFVSYYANRELKNNTIKFIVNYE